MAKTLGTVTLVLGDKMLVKVRDHTIVTDLLEHDKACKGGRMQNVQRFDVTAHYSQDLPEGEYAIQQPTAGGPIAAAVSPLFNVQQAELAVLLQSAFELM